MAKVSAGVGLGFVLGVLSTLYVVSSSSGRVITSWSQPSAIHYQSFDPYTLFVVETGTLRTLLSTRTTHELRVVHGTDAEGYGHSVEVSLDFAGDASDAFVKAAHVVWTEAGVSFEATSGHRIFIPKQSFVGGR